MIIKSDNKAIDKAINALDKTLVKHGSWFHPNLAVISENGSLSIQIEGPLNPGERIINVPQRLMMPAEDLHISTKGNDFVMDPDKDKVTQEQIDISEIMLEIYNLTEKVKLHKEECPWIKFRSHPKALELLAAARSTNDNVQIKKDYLNDAKGAKSDDEFITWSYLHSRVLGQKTEIANKKKQVVMPLIDFANHNHGGSPYIFVDNEGEESLLAVNNRQPFIDSRECYVMYGYYDTIDTYLNYGFPDTNAPFIRSVPIDLEVQGHPPINVSSVPGARMTKEMPKQIKDLRMYMPAAFKQKSGALDVSHFLIPITSAPHALRRILQVIIRSHAGKQATREFIIDAVFEAEDKIIKTNIEFYQSLLADLEKLDTPKELKSIISMIANAQLTKLYKYNYAPNFFNGKQVSQDAEEAIDAAE